MCVYLFFGHTKSLICQVGTPRQFPRKIELVNEGRSEQASTRMNNSTNKHTNKQTNERNNDRTSEQAGEPKYKQTQKQTAWTGHVTDLLFHSPVDHLTAGIVGIIFWQRGKSFPISVLCVSGSFLNGFGFVVWLVGSLLSSLVGCLFKTYCFTVQTGRGWMREIHFAILSFCKKYMFYCTERYYRKVEHSTLRHFLFQTNAFYNANEQSRKVE